MSPTCTMEIPLIISTASIGIFSMLSVRVAYWALKMSAAIASCIHRMTCVSWCDFDDRPKKHCFLLIVLFKNSDNARVVADVKDGAFKNTDLTSFNVCVVLTHEIYGIVHVQRGTACSVQRSLKSCHVAYHREDRKQSQSSHVFIRGERLPRSFYSSSLM